VIWLVTEAYCSVWIVHIIWMKQLPQISCTVNLPTVNTEMKHHSARGLHMYFHLYLKLSACPVCEHSFYASPHVKVCWIRWPLRTGRWAGGLTVCAFHSCCSSIKA
jgi:hypothetical protein